MRHLKMGFVTLVTTAAILVPAGAASATGSDTFKVVDASGNTVTVGDITTITTFCNLSVINAGLLGAGNVVDCDDGHQGHKAKPNW